MTAEGNSPTPAAAALAEAGDFHLVAERHPAHTSRTPRYIWVLLAIMVFLWSINFVVAKAALREFPPVLAGALRFTIAGAIAVPAWLLRRGSPSARPLDGRSFLGVLALGIVGVGVNQFCFVLGMAHTSVAHAGIIVALSPVLVLLLAAAIGQERLTLRKSVGLAIAVSGVALLQADTSKAAGAALLGDFFIFISAATFALFTVLGKRHRGRFDGLTVNTFAYAGSAIFLLPVTIYGLLRFPAAQVSWAGWASVAYMAVLPSLVCYMIFFHALRYVPASRISTLAYLQPLLATVFAIALLGESLSGSLISGGLLVLFGVFLTERS